MALTGTVAQLSGDFDVFVDGLPFNLHITKDTPYQRSTAEWRKQQIDTAPEAGEQSISDFWIRSQMSFHLGAGLGFLDTLNDQSAATSRFRFNDSRGVDVWTPGELKLLPAVDTITTTTGKTWTVAARSGTTDVLIYASGSTITVQAGSTTTLTATGPIADLYCDGSDYFYWAAGNALWRSPVTSPAATKLYDLTGTNFVIGYVKQRLMVGVDNKLYEAAGTAPSLVYTHPSTAWRWTDWSEAPNGIVVSGYGGLRSELFLITIDDSTGAPILQPPVSLAALPQGETAQCLYTYLGSFLLIGTNRGVRVGQFDSLYSSFSYGPVNLGRSVGAITARAEFVYAACNLGDVCGLIRMDLGTEVEKGFYPWATDLIGPRTTLTALASSVTVDGQGRLVFSVDGYGVFRESGAGKVSSGWLTTARIRMGTVALKTFKYGLVRKDRMMGGTCAVSAGVDRWGVSTVQAATLANDRFSLSGVVGGYLPDEETPTDFGVGETLQLTFTLAGSVRVNSYQVWALPAQGHSRLFSLPVAVFDHERNRNGKEIGYPGRAKELLDALEAAENTGREVTVACPTLGIDATKCTVERIEFTQSSAPTSGKSYGLGGYANLVFRATA